VIQIIWRTVPLRAYGCQSTLKETHVARVSAFIDSLGLRLRDVGNLPMARTLEHLCLLSLGLMAHAVKHTRFAIGVSVFV